LVFLLIEQLQNYQSKSSQTMTRNEFKALLQSYLDNSCSESERTLVDFWYASLEDAEPIATHTDWDILEEKLWANIQAKTDHTPVIKFNPWWSRWQTFAAAASVVLLIGTGLLFLLPNLKSNKFVEVVDGMGKYSNKTQLPITLLLPDSSKVVLEPESQLEYAIVSGYRDVKLSGEALFDVKRNPNQPFLVHTGDITTKVLGTSFRIKSDPETKDVRVTVIHGKVRVFRASTQNNNAQEEDVAVLTTNLTATYFAEQSLLQAGITESPVLVNSQKTYNFIYTETPLSEVLATMSEAYGVKIVLADDDIQQCPLTANLNNLNMYEQLDLICQTLNETHHETIRSTILISGRGCK
jgi:transmembrane sensor